MRVAAPIINTADRPFGLPLIEFAIDLPCPPSVNRTRRVDWHGAKKLTAWYKDADVLLLGARMRTRQPLPFHKIKGPFEATIVMSENHTSIDLDNGIKNILDYAVRVNLIPDDAPKFLRRLIVEWGPAIEGCRLTIRELAA